MAFKTQRFVNYYPQWSKGRVDASSVLYRLYDALAEYFDYGTGSLVSYRLSKDIDGLFYDTPDIYSLKLLPEDYIQLITTTGGMEYLYPTTVDVTVNGNTNSFWKTESLEELLYGDVASFVVNGVVPVVETVWDSNTPDTYHTMAISQRLSIHVSGSTKYLRYNTLDESSYRGRHFVHVEGLDEHKTPIKEEVPIHTDGIYQTQYRFNTVEKVWSEGFDGAVLIEGDSSHRLSKLDKHHVGVLPELEGPLAISIEKDALNNRAFIQFRAVSIPNAWSRNSDYEDEPFWEAILQDESIPEAHLDVYPDSFLIDPTGELIYLASIAEQKLYVFNLQINGFTPYLESPTGDGAIQVVPIKRWVRLGETERLWTYHRAPRYPIVNVVIKRTSPSGVIHYLATDKTWNGTVQLILGAGYGYLPEESWTDIQFTTLYDEIGEWEYSCRVTTLYGESVAVTKVMVPRLSTYSVYDYSGDGVSVMSELHLLSYDKEQVAINGTILKPSSYRYYADIQNQTLYFRDPFDSVDIIY